MVEYNRNGSLKSCSPREILALHQYLYDLGMPNKENRIPPSNIKDLFRDIGKLDRRHINNLSIVCLPLLNYLRFSITLGFQGFDIENSPEHDATLDSTQQEILNSALGYLVILQNDPKDAAKCAQYTDKFIDKIVADGTAIYSEKTLIQAVQRPSNIVDSATADTTTAYSPYRSLQGH
jgi:hypothetical protein